MPKIGLKMSISRTQQVIALRTPPECGLGAVGCCLPVTGAGSQEPDGPSLFTDPTDTPADRQHDVDAAVLLP